MDEPFDDADIEDVEHNIIPGNPVKIRKVTYQAFASSIYSVENAIEIFDYIGDKN